MRLNSAARRSYPNTGLFGPPVIIAVNGRVGWAGCRSQF